MAFIVKGGMKEISKKEMKAHLEELDKIDDPMNSLSDEKKQMRMEVNSAKRHREFMGRVAMHEEKDLENAIATSEIVSIAVGETIVEATEEPSIMPDVDFQSMTKKQIDMWAEENLGIQLDRRHTKAKLIEEIQEKL
jgi:hypothetical protein|tara:strand:- start:257 stop:667 length:411 start_codon:yes stop_codon:yes gene_type:complete